MIEFRSSKNPTIKFEALNTLITIISKSTVDDQGILKGICKDLMESIYEELTDIEDNKNLQIIILETLS